MSTVSGVTQRKVEVRSNFERYAFLFMRTTGIALLILAVGHMVIQHLLNSVHNLTLQFVANQWNDWGWKAYDLLLLVFALTHGMNGLRTVLGDYIHNRNTMKIINIILAVFVVITIIWAGYAIASFDAAPFLE
jgi:succinate dehydrogenase / fumarate reductase membrane anchor subunit